MSMPELRAAGLGLKLEYVAGTKSCQPQIGNTKALVGFVATA